LITLVIYDDVGVPIGVLAVATWAIMEGTNNFGVNLGIPMTAFVGTGAIYANAFTDLPQNNGVPYCPEASTSFQIDKP
jgi:hypothetical protein